MHVPVTVMATPPEAPRAPGVLPLSGSRMALGGFFVTGILLAFPGAILPVWQHHISSEYLMVGLYFVCVTLGLLAASRTAGRLLNKKGLAWTLSCACACASVALLYLAFFSPPFAAWWRMPGVLLIGWSAGVLHRGIFQAISPMYRHDPAATVNMAGILFGLGCFAVAWFLSRWFYVYTPGALQIWIAVVVALFAVGYARMRFPEPVEPEHPAVHMLMNELKTPGAVLLSLILFFQFGNEWAIAGWLPVFLSQRLGASPPAAILILAFYWLALMLGRACSQWILPRIRHSRLLGLSVFVSVFACFILLFTDNQFGAVSAVLLLGASFAPVYPLIVERIGRRFPDYHPGFYNGIFSFAIVGGLLAPSTLGYFAWLLDVRVAIGLPLIGSVIVFVLLGLLWIESRLFPSGTPTP